MQHICNCRKVAIPLPDGMTWDAFLQQASRRLALQGCLSIQPQAQQSTIRYLAPAAVADGPTSVTDVLTICAT